MTWHPITGEPLRPKDRDLSSLEVTGEVIHAMYDADNRLIFSYADGHLFVIEWNQAKREIVYKVLKPASMVTL
jgi:hypothetical protein